MNGISTLGCMWPADLVSVLYYSLYDDNTYKVSKSKAIPVTGRGDL
jgi:hypothetical protein